MLKIFFCMEIINPVLCKNSSIEIEVEQRNEVIIPHMHVYLDKTRDPKNCAYVRLDKAEYAPDEIRQVNWEIAKDRNGKRWVRCLTDFDAARSYFQERERTTGSGGFKL